MALRTCAPQELRTVGSAPGFMSTRSLTGKGRKQQEIFQLPSQGAECGQHRPTLALYRHGDVGGGGSTAPTQRRMSGGGAGGRKGKENAGAGGCFFPGENFSEFFLKFPPPPRRPPGAGGGGGEPV